MLTCMGCKQSCIVIEQRENNHLRGVYWWPVPGLGSTHESVPSLVAGRLDEAVRCLAVRAWNAAAVMMRNVLYAIIEDRGGDASSSDLKKGINDIVASGGFSPALGEWATHTRLAGNAGAHPDLFGDVREEEALDLQRLVQQLIEAIYVMPANIEKARKARGFLAGTPGPEPTP